MPEKCNLNSTRDTGETKPAARESSVVEDVHNLRLMTLLRRLVRTRTLKGAARKLGLDPRTVATCLREGMLSRRVEWALEASLKDELESETARHGERMDALEGRLSGLEDKLDSALEGIEKAGQREVDALRSDCDGWLRALEKRLARIEARVGPGKTVMDPAPKAEERAPSPPWRLHPDVVTPEAEPGDEDVYGEAAPLVAKWRNAVASVREGEEGVAGLDARARLLEMEIELIQRYRFTLPPSTYPWHDSERRDMVRVKTRALELLRAQRKRAVLCGRVRRALTLGRWRN